MRLGKSFGISLAVYVSIYIMLFVIFLIIPPPSTFFPSSWTLTSSTGFPIHLMLSTHTNLLLMPTALYIFYLFTWGSLISIGWVIVLILSSILPGLITSITAGRISESKKQAFTSWMLVMVLNGTILIVLYLFIPFKTGGMIYNFDSPEYLINSIFFYVLTIATNKIAVVIWIFVFEILTGLFYSGFAVISVKKNWTNKESRSESSENEVSENESVDPATKEDSKQLATVEETNLLNT